MQSMLFNQLQYVSVILRSPFVIVKVKGRSGGSDATESLLFGPSVTAEHEMS